MGWTEPHDWTYLEQITEALLDTNIKGNTLFLKKNIALGNALLLTIASGVVTKNQAFHKIAVQLGITDDLDTINGGAEGEMIFICAAVAGKTVIVKNGTGNIILEADINLDSLNKVLPLIYYNGKWQQFRTPQEEMTYMSYGIWGYSFWGLFVWSS